MPAPLECGLYFESSDRSYVDKQLIPGTLLGHTGMFVPNNSVIANSKPCCTIEELCLDKCRLLQARYRPLQESMCSYVDATRQIHIKFILSMNIACA